MQINRLFEIIYILLEKKICTANELAEHFEVSNRTIYRDIEVLSGAGIPIYMKKGRGGGIQLLPNFILNKAFLTEQEKEDILSSLKAVNSIEFTRSNTINKLDSMLGKSQNWIEVDFSSWANSDEQRKKFNQIKDCILDKKEIGFVYSSGRLEVVKREVMPLKLVFKGSAWYLYAFCKMRSDFRFFKLSRIAELEISEKHFNMDAPEQVLPRESFYTSSGINARLLVKKEMSFRVFDEISDFEINEEGDFICSLEMMDIENICDYAASFGPYAKILEPKAAYELLRERIEEMKKIYF